MKLMAKTRKMASDPEARSAYERAPKPIRKKVLQLREWILEVASECREEIGEVEETLKWEAPSYLPRLKNRGTTIRIEWSEERQEFGLFFHCQSSMIPRIRKKFPKKFRCQGNRAVIFGFEEKLPKKELKGCIRMALRYHLGG